MAVVEYVEIVDFDDEEGCQLRSQLRELKKRSVQPLQSTIDRFLDSIDSDGIVATWTQRSSSVSSTQSR